ncbi:hypothetical protein [Lysobacter humi (ex Lee et al. 2017)]
MVKFTLACFVFGWAFILAVAFGLISQESKLGFGPLIFFMAATMVGSSGGIEDPENRTLLFLFAALSLGSVLLYAVFRFFMLFGWAGH